MFLPTGFFHSRNFASAGQFPKTNPAKIKIPNIAPLPAAFKAAPNCPDDIFWFLFRSGDDGSFSHNNVWNNNFLFLQRQTQLPIKFSA